MGKLNGNNVHLKFGSTTCSAYWTKQLNYHHSAGDEDVTAGSGVTHVQRQTKLIDGDMDFNLYYDDETHATEIADLDIGSIDTLEYGPEGNASGKPAFVGSMQLADIKLTQGIDKPLVAYQLSFKQADAPTKTLEGGDTF